MTQPLSPNRAEAFIRANTALIAPPHVPEIRLHLADEAHDLWQRTEEELEAIGLQPPFWAFAWAGGQGLARHVLDNAGLVQGKAFLEQDEKFSSKLMVVNAECNMWILKEFLPDMMDRNSGHIVAIASLAGVFGVGGLTDYCASKFA